MNDPSLTTLAGVIFTAILTAFLTWYTTRTGAKSTAQSTAVQFADQLAERLEVLEKRVESLEGQIRKQDRVIRAFSIFTDRLGVWMESSQRGPRPVPPPPIHEYIDTSLWEPYAASGD